MTAAAGFHETPHRFRAEWIPPAEVVEDRDTFWVRTDGYRVADGLVDHGPGHFVRVSFAVLWIDPVREHNSFQSARANGFDDGRIRRCIHMHAGQRFDDRAALHFVVIDADDG